MKLVSLDKTWFVLRSAVRGEEKAVASIREARIEGVSIYLPRMKLERKDRRTNVYREIVKPLMVGYLFVGFDPRKKHFGAVANCDYVYDFVKVRGEPIPVPAIEIAKIEEAEIDYRFDDTRKARIHRKEEAKTRKLTTEMKFPPGKEVFVTDASHPFVDFHAVVEEVTKTGNIRALVNLFGRATSVEFQAGQLKPAA